MISTISHTLRILTVNSELFSCKCMNETTVKFIIKSEFECITAEQHATLTSVI